MTLYAASDTATAAEARLRANWTRTPVQGNGETSFAKPPGRPWVRLTVIPSLTSQFGVIGRSQDTVGHLHLDVFGPTSNVDEATVMRIADEVADLFRAVTFSGVTCEFPTVERGQDEPGYIRWRAVCPYKRIDTVGGVHDMAVYGIQTQAVPAHGFVRGQFIRIVSGGWALALADAEDHLADAVVAFVRDSGRFDAAYIRAAGSVEVPGHGLGTRGQRLYLSQSTPGAVVTSQPSSGLAQALAVVVDGDHLLLSPPLAVEIPS